MNSGAASSELRVLIVPATRRDGDVARDVLERAGICCEVCVGAAALAEQIEAGTGAILVTDSIGQDPALDRVTRALANQPAWSDIPNILLSRADVHSASSTRLAALLSNVTVLDRPTSTRTLISAVHAALRARRRQYEIREQLQALRNAEEALRSADRRKDEFLAMLAHELRNPLAPIRTATELLARQLPHEPAARAPLAIVERQIKHLTRLVEDLLDVSRITQGRIHLQREPLELSSIISQAIESVEPLLREKRHRIVITTSLQPLYVSGDNARLVQCVTNLLINAAKYTDAGGEVSVEIGEEAGGAAVVVRDNGIGIAAELLPTIFELFVQSDRALDRSEGGLGVGLSVVQRLVEMHGGRVSASSQGANQGSAFQIWLPLIPMPETVADQRPRPVARPRRILVVDDNVDAASSLAEVLRLDGHTAEAVFSAKRALQTVGTFVPDVVLLDIGLPEIDGYQVAKQIRAAGSPARLVAVTGYGQPEDKVRSRNAGFDAHVVKPVDMATLHRVISGAEE